jgi:hypothetical protein
MDATRQEQVAAHVRGAILHWYENAAQFRRLLAQPGASTSA